VASKIFPEFKFIKNGIWMLQDAKEHRKIKFWNWNLKLKLGMI